VTKWRTADLYGYADTPVIDFLNAVGEIGFQIRELGKIEQQDIEFEVATVKLWQCIRSLSKFATISPRHTEIMSALYTLTIGDNSLLNNAKLKGLDAVSELIQDNIGLPDYAIDKIEDLLEEAGFELNIAMGFAPAESESKPLANVFLETSALIELVFWDKQSAAKAQAAIPAKATKVTSHYVIYEIARGFLRNLILLHNKSCQVKGFSELQQYAGNNRFAQHRLGTIIGAFAVFFADKASFPANSDEELLLHFRGFMRRQIRRGWKAVLTVPDQVINSVQCRDDLAAPFFDKDELYEQTLKKNLCGLNSNCGLEAYYDRYREDFEQLRNELDPDGDAETTKRRRALRELYRHPKLNFQAANCYYCADATICHETPDSGPILTKNGKHFEPIGQTFAKAVISY